MPETEVQQIKRCAVYTRLSSNQLLERELNSLEVQRDICEAYVKSQRHKGWLLLPTRYDDGGHSGADAGRPALAALMHDIEAGLVDVVVIARVDRLTRSLADFVRLVEVLDRHSVPFVSVAQSFDTSDSVGRMIVNILLTFSQFERELIAERIRDNSRARLRRGKWHGGLPPLGYELVGGRLRVLENEAETVRVIFREFLRGGSYLAATKAVQAAGLRSTVKFTEGGRRRGGVPVSGGNVHRVVNNPVYVGELVGPDGNYPGEHEPIISRETWDAARALSASRVLRHPGRKDTNHFLAGLLWDSLGRRMLLMIEWDRRGLRKGNRGGPYNFYASSNAQWSQRDGRKQFRARADRLDQLVLAAIADFLCDRQGLRMALKALGVHAPELETLAARGAKAAGLLAEVPPEDLPDMVSALVKSVEVGLEIVAITFRSQELRRFLDWNGATKFRARPREWGWSDATHVHEVAVRAVSVERSPVIHVAARDPAAPASVDKALVRLVKEARKAQQMVESHRERTLGDCARALGRTRSYFARLVQLNYLAPDIVTAILDGTQPSTLRRAALLHAVVPLDWSLQRRLLGFAAPQRVIPAR